MPQTATFDRPNFPGKIPALIYSPARLMVIEWCSPKSFRVEAELSWLIEQAIVGSADQQFWFVAPDYTSAIEALTLLKTILPPGSFESLPRAQGIQLINGASISFRSAENPPSLVSNTVYALVADNAAKMREQSWAVIQETITNTTAKARIVSTVSNTSTWFNTLARSAELDGGSLLWTGGKFTALDAIEAKILSKSDIENARSTIQPHIFRAMYLCQPYDDRVENAAKQNDPRLMTDEELALIAGIDLNGAKLFTAGAQNAVQ